MSIWSNVCSSFETSLLIVCLDDISIGGSGVLRFFHYHCVGGLYVLLKFFLMFMGSPVFGVYMLMIDISSWWIVPLINMKWPSLSLLIDFSLNSTLSDISIATPACSWSPFAWKTFSHPLTLSQYFCLFVCLFQLDESFVTCGWVLFFNQVCYLCLLIGTLRPFTFSVNSERSLLFLPIFFPCYLVLPIPCLLVCLLKMVFYTWIFLSHSSFFFYR
jgi:hypothetical protein